MNPHTKKNGEESYPRLDQINSPDDVKALTAEEIPALDAEIRDFLIHRVTENGGHLASNLGVVELTVAIHRVFSTPKDHVIFDVGHQSYVHKLLTGRKDRFDTLRRGGGISGFPKRSESEHDCFGTGHSSTSLSASLGFAEADRMSGSDAYTVCVLGDGAYTGGMVHEALNNCRRNLRLIIILNENEMSISKNIGRFAKHLSKLRTTKGYFRTKTVLGKVLSHIPLIGEPLFRGILRVKLAVKEVLYGSNYFENLGMYYFGPANGNDEAAVERLLREAKSTNRCCVIHLKTKKGKGYAPAETTPDKYHGLLPSDVCKPTGTTFSEEMGRALVNLAAKDERICGITAAMAGGTGMCHFRAAYPNRFFDVGIAEEHAVTFAAGLAAEGYRPVVAVYSTFLQRAYDNIIHDVALQKLPVVFCVDRAGLNCADGATHHGIFDVAFLSEIPNLRLYAPITTEALKRTLADALHRDLPVAIRYPSGCENPAVVNAFYGGKTFTDIGVRADFAISEREENDVILITHGRIVTEAMRAEELLAARGIRMGILLLEMLKPYGEVAADVARYLPEREAKIVFLEEEIRTGGMGMLLSDALSDCPAMQNKTTSIIALPDGFGVQSADEPIRHSFGLDAEAIVRNVCKDSAD